MKVTKPKVKTPVTAPKKATKSTPKAAPAKAQPQGMLLTAIKAKATELGVSPGKSTKAELILAIQKAENNTPCFRTGTPACPYIDCCWRIDCIL